MIIIKNIDYTFIVAVRLLNVFAANNYQTEIAIIKTAIIIKIDSNNNKIL